MSDDTPTQKTPDVWHNGHWGVKCGTSIWTNGKKVVLLFHGEPEVVEVADVFATRAEAFTARQQKKMQELLKLTTEVSQLAGEAAKKEEP